MTMAQLPSAQKDPISHSISQHYHHSSHVVPYPNPKPSVFPTIQSVHDILRQHGLDPGTFSSSQLELFLHADVGQRQRLIQTWQLYSRSEQAPVVSACQVIQSYPANPVEDFEMNDSVDTIRDDHGGLAEPYMISGYEAAPPKEPTTGVPYASSTDPVYQSQQWWEPAQAGPVESQYGAFEEMNRYAACGVVQPRRCQN